MQCFMKFTFLFSHSATSSVSVALMLGLQDAAKDANVLKQVRQVQITERGRRLVHIFRGRAQILFPRKHKCNLRVRLSIMLNPNCPFGSMA
jgi:hypothetical protein